MPRGISSRRQQLIVDCVSEAIIRARVEISDLELPGLARRQIRRIMEKAEAEARHFALRAMTENLADSNAAAYQRVTASKEGRG